MFVCLFKSIYFFKLVILKAIFVSKHYFIIGSFSEHILLNWLYGYESIHFQSRPYLVQFSHRGRGNSASIPFYVPVRYLLERSKLVLSIGAVCLWFYYRRVSFFSFFYIDIHCKIRISEDFSKVVAHSK